MLVISMFENNVTLQIIWTSFLHITMSN